MRFHPGIVFQGQGEVTRRPAAIPRHPAGLYE
jgi:hypothetical protein